MNEGLAGTRQLIEEASLGARLFAGLPGFLRKPLSPEQGRRILRQRLARREIDFVRLVERAIYPLAGNPYRRLLEAAGCQPGDLRALVAREGLEGALGTLFRKGVYLTIDEFRGRRPVRRGSHSFETEPDRLHNPWTAFQVRGTSGGSRGVRRLVPYSLACFRDRALNTMLTLEAQGGGAWPRAVWGVPGGSMGNLLRFTPFGRPPVRWFVQIDPSAPGLHPRYRWSARALRLGAAPSGVRLPSPEFVPYSDPLPIVRWLAETLRAGQVPHLELFVSSAVRLSEVACEAGISLEGARFQIIGEPTTAARLRAIRRSGARAVPDYGSSEAGGPAGYGCLEPDLPDDIHLFQDLHALIQPGPDCAETALPPDALLITSLRDSSPLVLLNLSMGDRGELLERACGCPIESLGWRTHLWAVRSFEKLTAAGMTFHDVDVVQVLEETLPNRFGGGPTDYQLVEEEDPASGRPGLCLLVHPRLGPLDPEALASALLESLGAGSGTERVMGLVWQDAGLLRVSRELPRTTAGGKVQHLHVDAAPAGLAG